MSPEKLGIKCRILADQRVGCSEKRRTQIAIVDASAACHMPDVLEMLIFHHFWEQMRQKRMESLFPSPPLERIGRKELQLPEYGDL